jgi:CRISPR-associated protein Cmr6
MSKNLHQQYYKNYFNGLDFSYLQNNGQAPDRVKNEIKRRNTALCERNLLERISRVECVKEDQCFKLEILYPGLVTGIGINHEAKIEGEFKLGVHFDWTYGMPVVYGSSVKGVLKSYFKEFYEPNGNQPEVKDAIKDIFEGEGKSIYHRDIFFDAVIVEACKNGNGPILCSDSITPHGANPLKNPVPITFLKIAPGCKLEFRFKLVDTEIAGKKLSANDKLKIFKEILRTVGVGAKTNVGYGQLK